MPTVTFEQAIAFAMEHHAAGRLAEAESICRQILAAQPDYADALHLLGVIAFQVNNPAAAIELISRAITVAPNHPDSHSNLGLALMGAGRIDDAIAAFEAALRLDPNFAQAHNNLGKALHAAGRVDDSVAAFGRAIALKGDLAEAHINLGNVLKLTGQIDASIQAYRTAVAAAPNLAEAHLGLGNALRAAERIDEAIAAFRSALAINPRQTKALNNLANALAARGQHDQAIPLYNAAIAIDPNLAAVYVNLGVALQELEKYDGAIEAFRVAIRLEPDSADAHYNLARCLQLAAFRPAALEEFRIVERLAPDRTDVKYWIGLALYEMLHLDEAIDQFRAALAVNPSEPMTYNTLGNALKDRCELAESLNSYRRAIELAPDYVAPYNNLVYTMHFDPGSDMRAIRAEQDRWTARFAEPLKKSIRPHANDHNENRRLKIAYVSPNFRHHAEAHFVLPLLEAHDHEQFEIHCYSDYRRAGDNVTAGMRRLADVWHDVHRLSNARLAEKVRADRIDILIDLTMQMSDDRMLMLAEKPAPIQIAYLAYPGSSGLATMDYRITDRYMDPPETDDSWAVEQALRLPDSWCVYHTVSQYPDVNDPPALSNGHITFGSLNNFCKCNEQVLTRWANVLRAIEKSRLILLCPSGQAQRRTTAFFAERGIAPDRIEFVSVLPRPEYLQTYLRIDIALDPFPYNGITTTCDALWMGVPMLTLPGNTPASRAGLGLLTVAGVPEFIAQSEDHYIDLAKELATDLPRLKTLRSTLRAQTLASPLMNAPRFARNLESAYREIWKRWCR